MRWRGLECDAGLGKEDGMDLKYSICDKFPKQSRFWIEK